MKGLRVTKTFKQIKFEGVRSKFERVRRKKKFPVTIIYKIFETNSSFDVK